MKNKELSDQKIIKEKGILNKAWYTLKEACTIKGLNIKTAYNNRMLMPNKGVYEGKIGGRLCFKQETVLDWLSKTDNDLLNS